MIHIDYIKVIAAFNIAVVFWMTVVTFKEIIEEERKRKEKNNGKDS